MPGCVLRVYGRHFDVDDYVKTSGVLPYVIWHRGDTRRSGKPPLEHSGFNLLVSDASGDDGAAQVDDAVKYLIRHVDQLEKLRNTQGIEVIALDFGVNHSEIGFHTIALPPSLIQLAARFNMQIEVSHYP